MKTTNEQYYKLSDDLIKTIRGLFQEVALELVTETEGKERLNNLFVSCSNEQDKQHELVEQETDASSVETTTTSLLKLDEETWNVFVLNLNFSLMTKTSFIDLLRQVRLKLHLSTNSFVPTVEYQQWFESMVNDRVKLASLLKTSSTAPVITT